MGLFKKLFGKKTKESATNVEKNTRIDIKLPKIKTQVVIESSSEPIEENTYNRIFKFNQKEIKITEFNNELTKRSKNENYESIYSDYTLFVNTNQDEIEFEDKLRLVNNFVNIQKKSEIEVSCIAEFVTNELTEFDEYSAFENIIRRAKLLSKFDKLSALVFLQEQNQSTELQNNHPRIFIESNFMEAELLLKRKEFDKAFKTLNKSSRTLPQLSQFDYISWQRKQSDLRAEICFTESKPKMDSYLYNELRSFHLSTLQEIANFPYWTSFHNWESKSLENQWPFNDNKRFDQALTELGLLEKKDEILKEQFNFSYKRLPILYGIPDEYIKPRQENIEREEVFSRARIGRKLNEKFLDEEIIEISEAIEKTFEKYKSQRNNQT